MTAQTIRTGWTPAEKEILMEAVRRADESGASLRSVFEETGMRLGRKPNSVRNFYYLQLRAREGRGQPRALPFETFTEEEVQGLVRQILLGKSRGQSVRACVMELSRGNKTVMLRYQNKYRAVLKKKPEMIRELRRALEQEGIHCPDPLEGTGTGCPDRSTAWQQNLQAMDRMKVQQDLMRMQLEDMQAAARATLLLCKDFLGLLPEEKQGNLNAFCQELSSRLAVLENAAN